MKNRDAQSIYERGHSNEGGDERETVEIANSKRVG